jgi:hypothetical protein
MKTHIPNPTDYTIVIIPIQGTVAAAILENESERRRLLKEFQVHDAQTTHIVLSGTYQTRTDERILRTCGEMLRTYFVYGKRSADLEGPNFNDRNVHIAIDVGGSPREIEVAGEMICEIRRTYMGQDKVSKIILFASRERCERWSIGFDVLSVRGTNIRTDERGKKVSGEPGPWEIPPITQVLESRRWQRHLENLWEKKTTEPLPHPVATP